MTIGTDLFGGLQRRLGESGLSVESARETELYAFLTEGRDETLERLAEECPFAVVQVVALEQVSAGSRQWKIPDDTLDPLRAPAIRDSGSGRELEPSSELNQDAGEYVYVTPRLIQLADHLQLEGDPELVAVLLAAAPIDADAEQEEVGLPATCNRAIVLQAAVLALTADEESDATKATELAEAAFARLVNRYGSFDLNDGIKLRHALMRTMGRQSGDMLD